MHVGLPKHRFNLQILRYFCNVPLLYFNQNFQIFYFFLFYYFCPSFTGSGGGGGAGSTPPGPTLATPIYQMAL